MTDYQFTSIIEMMDIILENSRDIAEAREKLARLKRKEYAHSERGDSDSSKDEEN